jgi:2-C-methyl-D-erythritol 4-phosphate cytidylyltransferase
MGVGGPGRPARVAAVVLAGGSGSRVGAAVNKVYLPLAGRSVISRSLATFAEVPGVDVLVLVVRPADRERAEAILAREVDRPGVELVYGGASRQESELCALRHLAARIDAGAVDVVLIHDGARPLVSPTLAAEVIAAARAHGGAVPGLHRRDLARVSPDGRHLAGRAPTGLFAVQTPQGFRAGPLLAAYEEAAGEGFAGTDTASCVERFTDLRVRAVPGEPSNFKITYAHDLLVAERVLAGPPRSLTPYP